MSIRTVRVSGLLRLISDSIWTADAQEPDGYVILPPLFAESGLSCGVARALCAMARPLCGLARKCDKKPGKCGTGEVSVASVG